MSRFLLIFVLFSLVFSSVFAQDTFQLATPYLEYSSVFFEKKCTVAMTLAEPGTQIHYTTNGKIPTLKDPLYVAPISIKKTKTLKAKAFGSGFYPSEVAEATFFKAGIKIDSINHDSPNPKYAGSGPNTLIDGQGGEVRFSDNCWMGFNEKVLTCTLTMSKPHRIKRVMIHALSNQNAWIFLPQEVEIHLRESASNRFTSVDTVIKELGIGINAEALNTTAIWVDLPRSMKITQIILKIYPRAEIPDWHPGAGTGAWLFLDEIKLY